MQTPARTPQGPPLKKPRLSTPAISFLRLHDDVIEDIFTTLNNAHTQSLRHIPCLFDAYSLACTNKHLHALYSRSLPKLNARDPVLPHLPVTVTLPMAGVRFASVIQALSAGLQQLTVPTLAAGHMDFVLLAAAKCHRLSHVALTDNGDVSEVFAERFFSACTSLESVNILAAKRPILHALPRGLRRLELHAMSADFPDLIAALKRVGLELLELTIGACNATQDGDRTFATRFDGLFDYLQQYMQRDFPCLRVLDLRASPWLTDVISLPMYDHLKTTLIQRVSFAREAAADSPHSSSLQTLRIRANSRHVLRCLNGLILLISKHTELIVQYPGGELIFSPHEEPGRISSYKSIQPGRDVMEQLKGSEGCFAKLETLIDPGPRFRRRYGNAKRVLARIVKTAGPNLKCIKAPYEQDRQYRSSYETCLADLLGAAEHVESFESHISLFSGVGQPSSTMPELLLSLRKVQNLCLYSRVVRRYMSRRSTCKPSCSRKSSDQNSQGKRCSCAQEGRGDKICTLLANRLTTLLDVLALTCKSLESVRLKLLLTGRVRLEDRVATGDAARDAVRNALDAVDRFERDLPRVDASSIRIELMMMLDSSGVPKRISFQ